MNNCISNNNDINAGFGLLAPVKRPGKTKEPMTNARPVILLPVIRKILSNAVLARIKPKVDEYFPLQQNDIVEKEAEVILYRIIDE